MFNRFGLPLVLFTVVDNHGITNLIAGCLLCNEQFDSYQWAFDQLKVRRHCLTLPD
jgi:hypothetical protein